MVGPGEVDDELEPEVKEECNGKYGDVISVIVFEVPNAPTPEESVRIFIEFKRVESAIKGKKFGIISICSMIIRPNSPPNTITLIKTLLFFQL